MPHSTDPRVIAMMAHLTANLKAVREHRGMSQEEAARAAGFRTGALSKWEQGAWIDPGSLKILADVYRFPLDQFFVKDPPWLQGLPSPTQPTRQAR